MLVKLEGVEKLKQKVKGLSLKGNKRAEYEIRFDAPYAIFVHENLEAKWRGKEKPRPSEHGDPGLGVYWGTPFDSYSGEPKWLEKAYRRLRKQTIVTITKMLQAKRSLDEAILKASRDILALSLTMVPIETGKLYLSSKIVPVG